jgi:cytochrome c biogenesis factor
MSVSERAPAATGGAESVGRTSLWLAITGLVLPILVAITVAVVLTLANASEHARHDGGPYYLLCFLLFVVLELAALVCGIVGLRSGAGKAGLILSSISLGLTVIGVVLSMGFFMVARVAPSPAARENAMPEAAQPEQKLEMPVQPVPEQRPEPAPEPARPPR